MQVGVGPNREKLDHQFQQTMQVGGAQHREIGTPISTDNASWGGTLNKKDGKSAYKNVKVGETGPKHKEILFL